MLIADAIIQSKNQSEELFTLWKKFYVSYLCESETNTWLPKDIEISGRTIQEFHDLVVTTLQLVSQLSVDEKSLPTIPAGYIDNIASSLSTAISKIKSLEKAAGGNTTGAVAFNALLTDRTFPDKSQVGFKYLLITSFPDEIDTILTSTCDIFQITNKLKVSGFRDSQTIINRHIERLKSFIENKQNEATEFFTDSQATIKDILDDSGITYKNIEELETSSQVSFDNIEELNKTVTSRFSNLPSQAQELEENVTGYSAKFTKFDNDLKIRNDNYNALSNHLTKQKEEIDLLVEESKNMSAEIDRLSEESKKLLAGSTNSALAASFKELMESTSINLRKSEVEHNDSLKMLLGVVCLVVGIFTGLLIYQKISLNQPTAWIYVFLAVLPISAALLRVSHTSNRHNSLFRLHEDYAYKYSIARAVEGYKKQAPKYEDEIAATTFFEIAFNPADNADLKDVKKRKDKGTKSKFFNALLVKFGFKNENLDGLALFSKTLTDEVCSNLKKIPLLQTQLTSALAKKMGDDITSLITELMVPNDSEEENEER